MENKTRHQPSLYPLDPLSFHLRTQFLILKRALDLYSSPVYLIPQIRYSSATQKQLMYTQHGRMELHITMQKANPVGAVLRE
jgi:hypothetical protein